MSEILNAADLLYGSAQREAASTAAPTSTTPPEDATADDGQSAVEPAPEAASLYPDADITTRGYVKFDEPALNDPASFQIEIPEDLANPDPAAANQLRAALAAAGAGATTAREVIADAVAAARQGPRSSDPAKTMAELRQSWGSQTETRLAAARDLVRRAAAHDPSIPGFLARTGLGNDAGFIRKLAARATRRGGR
jgi:hypothetical protein